MIKILQKNIIYILLLIATVCFFACRKNINQNSTDDEIKAITNELKGWLQLNGEIYTSGEIYIKSNNIAQKGSLNWDNLTVFKKGENSFYEVPFTFTQNSDGSYFHKVTAEDFFPAKYSLIIQKNQKGNIVARIKLLTRNFTNSSSTVRKFVDLEFFDDLKGERDAVLLWKSKTSNAQPVRLYKDKTQGELKGNGQSDAYRANYMLPDCESYDVPNREYLCFAEPIGSNYNVSCGYYFTSFTRYTVCDPGGANPGSGGAAGFDYPGYSSGSNGTPNVPNKKIIDSLQGYPCAQSMLATAIFADKDACEEVFSLFLSTFGVTSSNGVLLTYRVDPTLTMDSLLNGYAKNTFASLNAFEEEIFLNPSMLRGSTNEFTYSVMLHEGVHALIDFWRGEQLVGRITLEQFNNMFPLFANYGRPLYTGEQVQHMQMAESYIGSFKSAIKRYNTSMSDTMATALAWMGLQKTPAWKLKTDTANLLTLQHIARRDGADSSAFTSYLLKKCP